MEIDRELIIAIHLQKRIGGIDNNGVGVEGPIEAVEDGGEGIGNGDVVVDEETVLIAATLGHTPTHDLRGTGEDLGLTGGVLAIRRFGGNTILETTSVDDGEKAITQLTLDGLREFNRDDFGRTGFIEHGPQAFGWSRSR